MKNRHFLHSLEVLLAERGITVDDWFAEIEREDKSPPGRIKQVFEPDRPVLPRNMYVMAERLGISNDELAERIKRDNKL
ncbi:MAG: hypothetical protein NXH70_11865 [Hyphomonas sp.]|nr:hypothetical protein [Hyphomonas sp.]